MRRLLEVGDVRAEWRIDVHDSERLSHFQVTVDGHTFRLSAVATRTLRDALSELLEAADRFATAEGVMGVSQRAQ